MKNIKLKLNKKLFIATIVLAFVSFVIEIAIDLYCIKYIQNLTGFTGADYQSSLPFFIVHAILFIALIVLGIIVLLKQNKKDEAGRELLFIIIAYYICFGISSMVVGFCGSSSINSVYALLNIDSLITTVSIFVMLIIAIVAFVLCFFKNKYKIIKVLTIACSMITLICYVYVFFMNISIYNIGSAIAFNVLALISLFLMKELKEESNEKEVTKK